jgi:hypothetical protein
MAATRRTRTVRDTVTVRWIAAAAGASRRLPEVELRVKQISTAVFSPSAESMFRVIHSKLRGENNGRHRDRLL